MRDKKDRFKEKKITSRDKDYSQWYLDVVSAADLAEHSSVKGCMIIKPYGYAIWENIQRILDEKIKETGVENAYFPLFIPQSFLSKEEEHVEGFSPECAVVTHAGGKKLEEPLVVRPTSETIMYDAFSKWIESYRDLPLLINQWANVVRWELRPRLFLRTTEFLWQEGHTAHATKEEAEERTKQMLGVYQNLAENYLAIPVIPGVKSELEKFAGADHTYTIEAMMQDRKALQSGTSHMLGQNFAEAFDIKFLGKDGKKYYVWQTSWGLSTRIIGALIMTHSDDKGLILPPKIASIDVVVIPIWASEKERKTVLDRAEKFVKEIKDFKVKLDDRDMRPGPRFFEWEKKGVPIRIEIGPQDVKNKSVVAVRRDNSKKETVKDKDISAYIKKALEDIQKNLFNKALKFQKDNTYQVNDWDEFKDIISKKGGFIFTHWCGNDKCEAKIKKETKATIRCIPFGQKEEKGKCILCGGESIQKAIFAKAY
jgi:prolyl-tRNA synthetase